MNLELPIWNLKTKLKSKSLRLLKLPKLSINLNFQI